MGAHVDTKSGGNIQTAGRWPRKLEPFKECVTTHLPNVPALKMDGAQAPRLKFAHAANAKLRGVGWRIGAVEGYSVRRTGGAFSADLV